MTRSIDWIQPVGRFGARDYDHDKNGNRRQLIADGVTTTLAYYPQQQSFSHAGCHGCAAGC